MGSAFVLSHRMSCGLLAIVVLSVGCGDETAPTGSEPLEFVQLSAGWKASCGLTADGEL
jgi:hypothetical protein